MKDRIKLVRESLTDANGKKYSQAKFADALCVSRDSIANIELGRATITDLFISQLCSKFNVNEDWLRTGNGKMFCISREAQIADIASRLYKGDDDDFRVKMVNLILQMNDEEIELFKRLAHRVADMVNEESRPK